ncbi:MAG: 1-acyl-sn-glycerol-3-phosphate acyltransferase [Spirochaetes bacterium]|nr:1-acyl-sn-glycerol-3-phosphate acyltransferase [Spirochaetota bacterium]
MAALYFFYSMLLAILVEIFSLIQVLLFWWFLLLPKYKRFRLFFYVVAEPWIFFVVRFLLMTRLKVIDKKHIDNNRTSLYICNHQSWVDVPVLFKYTKALGVSKKEVTRLPIVGLLIIYASPILVDRVNINSRMGILKELIRNLKQGYSITLFPEGTRSSDGKILTSNNAAVKLCYKLNIPVVTSSIEGTRDILPRKRFYLKFFQRVVLKFNPPLYPKDFKNEDEFAEQCWNAVINTHKEILREYFPKKFSQIYS